MKREFTYNLNHVLQALIQSKDKSFLEECNDACKKEFLFLPNKKAYEGYQKRKRAPRLLIIFLDEETR